MGKLINQILRIEASNFQNLQFNKNFDMVQAYTFYIISQYEQGLPLEKYAKQAVRDYYAVIDGAMDIADVNDFRGDQEWIKEIAHDNIRGKLSKKKLMMQAMVHKSLATLDDLDAKREEMIRSGKQRKIPRSAVMEVVDLD